MEKKGILKQFRVTLTESIWHDWDDFTSDNTKRRIVRKLALNTIEGGTSMPPFETGTG